MGTTPNAHRLVLARLLPAPRSPGGGDPDRPDSGVATAHIESDGVCSQPRKDAVYSNTLSLTVTHDRGLLGS
jgi:hypothetical protein